MGSQYVYHIESPAAESRTSCDLIVREQNEEKTGQAETRVIIKPADNLIVSQVLGRLETPEGWKIAEPKAAGPKAR